MTTTTETPAVKTHKDNGLIIPEHIAVGDWGAVEELEATDLLVPKIFHQQALSKFVSDGVAKPGDFCDSMTGEVLAEKGEKLEVIVFGSFKTAVISKLDVFAKPSPKWIFDRIVTITPENAREWASKPFEEQTEEGAIRNALQYNFYCLIPSKIKELPYVLTLGSTKTKAAKKLNTMLFKLSQLKRPGASVVFNLLSTTEKNDRGQWFGLEISQGRNATESEILLAHAWYLKSKSQKFTVVEEEAKVEHDDSGDVNL